MQGVRGAKRLGPVGLAVVVAMAGAVLTVSGQAIAGAGTTCSPPSAAFDVSVAGDKSRVSVGYERNSAPAFDSIGYHAKGVNAVGDPTESAGTCGDEDKFETVSVSLGDRRDSLRLDGRKPKVLSGNPVPKFVDVTAFGGAGRDTLRGHRGHDTMNGEGGNDVIKVAGGGADTANCGPGNDTVFLSGADQAVGCEHAG
jgi:Ca2+-binding RTX toxin-like protein